MIFPEDWFALGIAGVASLALPLAIVRAFFCDRTNTPQIPFFRRLLPLTPIVALAGFTGGNALGPSLLDSPHSGLRILAAVLGSAISCGVFVFYGRRASGIRAVPLLVTLQLGLLATYSATLWSSRIEDAPPQVTAPAAKLRRALAPWDGAAMLALAWHDRRADRLAAAELRADRAERANVDVVRLGEFRAELHAAQGDCDRARAAFDRALLTLTERQTESQTFELGGFQLPPTLISACGVVDDETLVSP